MAELPELPRGRLFPDYQPFGRPRPKKVRWRQSRKLPGWLLSGNRPEFTTPDQYVAWSDPVWLWFEGRDGMFLLSSSFLIIDMGHWVEGPRGQEWRERGMLYLYLATHSYLQWYGPQALSLTPRAELPTLGAVLEPQWAVDGVTFAGVSPWPDCYVAPRALPWQAGVGAIATPAGPSTRSRSAALGSLKESADRYYHQHESARIARQTFEEHLWISEHKPCEFVVRESGWWNVGMCEIFAREAPPVYGQMELVPLENWQEFDVNDATGEWEPVEQ